LKSFKAEPRSDLPEFETSDVESKFRISAVALNTLRTFSLSGHGQLLRAAWHLGWQTGSSCTVAVGAALTHHRKASALAAGDTSICRRFVYET
jgi:hypothetical protein